MISAHIETGWAGGTAGKGMEMEALDHPTPLPCPMHLLDISIEYLTDVRVGVKK